MEKFEGCYFTTRPKTNNSPARRWGHTAVVMQGQMFLFGGYTGMSEMMTMEPLYKMDVESGNYERIFAQRTPQSRDSHTCIVFDNQMFVWGGCINGEVRADMYCFEGGAWKKVQQLGATPPPRESQQAVSLSNRWILLFGGYNGKTKYEDCFIFDRFNYRWYELPQLAKRIDYREAASVCVVQNSIYIFGGQDKRSKLTNTLFRVKLDFNRGSPSGKEPFSEVSVVETKSQKPAQRCSHTSTSYQDRFIIVVGGQTEQPDRKNKVLGLNDIWLFDTLNSIWSELRPYNQNLFPKRSTFSTCLANDTLIIFGGMDPQNPDDIYGQTVYLHLTKKIQNGVIKICEVCAQPEMATESDSMEVEEAVEESLILMDVSTLRSLESSNHPFQLLGHLISNILLQGCRRLQTTLKCEDQSIVLHLGYELKQCRLPSWKLSTEIDLLQLLCCLSKNIVLVDNYTGTYRVTLLLDGLIYRVISDKNGQVGREDRLMMKYIRPFMKDITLSSHQHQIFIKMEESSLDHFVTDSDHNLSAQNFNLLQTYFRHVFLQQPKQMQFFIQNELIMFGTTDRRQCQSVQLPKELRGEIYYSPDTQNAVLIYNKNILVGVFGNIGRGKYAGHLSMSEDFDTIQWKIEKLQQALQQVVSQHDYLQGKRRPATTLEHLEEESKISMLSI